jgi:hypothetical protein
MSGHTPAEPPHEGQSTSDDARSTLGDEFVRLIQCGREILFACGWNGHRYAGFRPGGVEVLKFCRRTEALIKRTLGAEHPHHRRLVGLAADPRAARKGFYVHEYVRILERALADHQRDGVFHAPEMMFESLAGDCIEVAEALLNAGCHIAAARRAGIVLEQTIRRIGQTRGVEVDAFSADELNDVLRDRRAYDDTTHRRIGACLQITRDMRQSLRVPLPDAELDEMVHWVRAFAVEHRLLSSDTEHSRQ